MKILIHQFHKIYIHPWVWAIFLIFISLTILLLIYQTTIILMLNVWNTHTYAHCYLILPISGYLIWRQRFVLYKIVPYPEIFPLFLIALLCLGWLVGNIAGAMVVQEYAMVSMIPAIVWAILGWNIIKRILFPLAFLLFCVPFGDFLIPRMIEFTSAFTVGMLRFSGIPVYQEGNFFSIPSGDWSVVEACAGLRYFIASITLGALFAYFNFKSITRRILFVVLSGIVPVILNGIRAYFIVMIGHFSDMKLGVGDDHFVYGWIFFGLGMALLFWFGAKWSEDIEYEHYNVNIFITPPRWNPQRMFILAFFALTISAIGPLRAAYIHDYSKYNGYLYTLDIPKPISPWYQGQSFTNWYPNFLEADLDKKFFFTDGNNTIGVFLEYYEFESQGHELVNSNNVLVKEKNSVWKLLQENPTKIILDGNTTTALAGELKSPAQTIFTWRWYWVSGIYTSNNFLAKIINTHNMLLGRPSPEAAIILIVDSKGNLSNANRVLQSFIDAMLPSIKQSLQKVNKIQKNG